MRILAIAPIAVGVLALMYGGFSYTRQTHDAKFGPREISVSEKQRVNVPAWAGVVLVVAGAGRLLTGKKRLHGSGTAEHRHVDDAGNAQQPDPSNRPSCCSTLETTRQVVSPRSVTATITAPVVNPQTHCAFHRGISCLASVCAITRRTSVR
jgi:hypothetical protein